MAASVGTTAQAFFLQSPSGKVLAVHHRLRDAAAMRGHVLIVPAFNEEMNRCRSMVTLQARAFAALGLGTLVVDLHGTGDSQGEFRDGRWALWQRDLQAAHHWLSEQPGGCRGLLGIRLGAILAAQLHGHLRDAALRLMLWQPVTDGKIHLTQFLRVRMAAQLDRPNLPKETTASMRQQFAAGECVEVGGYEIHPELASAMDQARLADTPPEPGTHAVWLENAAGDSPDLPPASQKLVDAWQERGIRVHASVYPGPAFWQVHERVLAPAIIRQTSDWLQASLEMA